MSVQVGRQVGVMATGDLGVGKLEKIKKFEWWVTMNNIVASYEITDQTRVKIDGGVGGFDPPGAVVDPLEKCQNGAGGRFWAIFS